MRKFGLVITLLSQLLVGLIQFSIYTISRMKRIKRIINKYNWHFLMFSYSKDEINQINLCKIFAYSQIGNGKTLF